METLSFNSNSGDNSNFNKDLLSGFKEKSDKNSTIKYGMTVKEISEIVSEKIIKVVKDQFEATKIQFEQKEKKQTC